MKHLLTLLLFISTSVMADENYSLYLEECLKDKLPTVTDMKVCGYGYIEHQEKQITKLYLELLQLFSEEKKEILKKEQKEWIANIDKARLENIGPERKTYDDYESLAKELGRIGEIEYMSRLKEIYDARIKDLTKQRTDELAVRLN